MKAPSTTEATSDSSHEMLLGHLGILLRDADYYSSIIVARLTAKELGEDRLLKKALVSAENGKASMNSMFFARSTGNGFCHSKHTFVIITKIGLAH